MVPFTMHSMSRAILSSSPGSKMLAPQCDRSKLADRP